VVPKPFCISRWEVWEAWKVKKTNEVVKNR
jgi:hypothetical protein